MPHTNFCFPSDPMSPRKVDSEYALDAKAFSALGANIFVWSMDEPNAKVKAATGFPVNGAATGAPVVWRGWMLDSAKYQKWLSALGDLSSKHTLSAYEMHHRMRHWVPAVKDFTPATWFINTARDARMDMFPCHVKDGVKSANASHLPRPCRFVEDIEQHEAALVRQRGALDDGLVLRAHANASPDETRVWVFGPEDYMYCRPASGGAPMRYMGFTEELDAWLYRVVSSMPPAFFEAPFTMDVGQLLGMGDFFVMDMGDAGVSDYKEGHAHPVFLDQLRTRWYRTLGALPNPDESLYTSDPAP